VSSVRYRKNINGAGKVLVALLSIAVVAVSLAAAEKLVFKAKPVTDYQSKVSFDGIAMAAEPFDLPDETKLAFGPKLFPPQYGVLPVLIVIENKRPTPINAKGIRVTYRAPGEQEIDSSSAMDIRYASGPSKPKMAQAPLPVPVPLKGKKNPLAAPEFEERAFSANMIAPGDSASGFVYFLTEYHGQVTITVAGLRDAGRNQEIFFYEIPVTHR